MEQFDSTLTMTMDKGEAVIDSIIKPVASKYTADDEAPSTSANHNAGSSYPTTIPVSIEGISGHDNLSHLTMLTKMHEGYLNFQSSQKSLHTVMYPDSIFGAETVIEIFYFSG